MVGICSGLSFVVPSPVPCAMYTNRTALAMDWYNYIKIEECCFKSLIFVLNFFLKPFLILVCCYCRV